MATLTLARPDIGFDTKLAQAISLVDWLDGRWALVLSHPQDFATLDLEADRWREIVADALCQARVQAIRLQSPQHRFGSWIEQIEGGDALLVLEHRKRVSSDGVSSRAAAVRSVLTRTTQRCAVILDERLQVHHVFTYDAGRRVPSVLDLIAYAESLRQSARAEAATIRASAKVIELAARDAILTHAPRRQGRRTFAV